MRLHELIAQGRREGQPDEESYARLAARAPFGTSTATFVRLGRAPKPEDLIETAWDTLASARNFSDPPSLVDIHRLFKVPLKTVVLANAESALGVPMFEDADPIAESVALLPDRWHTLKGPWMAQWHRHGATLVESQDQQAKLAELEAENKALRQRLTQLEGAPAPQAEKPATGKRRKTP